METNERWQPVLRVYCPLKAGSIDGTDTRPHDRAIERALKAIYKPNKTVQGDAECTLFVGRLDPATSENTLNKIFSKYGDILHLRIVRDIVTGMSKQYAFIEYSKQRYASRAVRDANRLTVDGRDILVEWVCERTLPKWIPRRLGGGFGGKKESGQLRFGGSDRPFRRPIVIVKQDAGRGGQQDRCREGLGGSHSDRGGNKYGRERRRGSRDREDDRRYDRQGNREGDKGRYGEGDRGRYREGDKGRYGEGDRGRYRKGDKGRYGEEDRDRYKEEYTGRHRDRDRDIGSDRRGDGERIGHRDRYDDSRRDTEGHTQGQESLIKMEHGTCTRLEAPGIASPSTTSQLFVMNIKHEKL